MYTPIASMKVVICCLYNVRNVRSDARLLLTRDCRCDSFARRRAKSDPSVKMVRFSKGKSDVLTFKNREANLDPLAAA
jgi:hypothetical protein